MKCCEFDGQLDELLFVHSWCPVTRYNFINACNAILMEILCFFMSFTQGYDGEPPILLKEEPEDGPRSFQKVPSLSDLSEESLGECLKPLCLNLITRQFIAPRTVIKT